MYTAPKLEKIVFTVTTFREKLMSYAAIIWPDDEHALPVFQSFWAESAKGSYFILDFYPTAECICDIAYVERYLEPLEDVYNGAIKYYNKVSTRGANWFRCLVSPYYISADVSQSTKQSQERLLSLTLDYMNIYHELWEKDEARDPRYMERLNRRKEAIRINMREKDPGGIMMVKAVGEELAELGLRVLF
jgi:hypothetical protein